MKTESELVRASWNKGLERKFVEGVAEVALNKHHRAIAQALLTAWDRIDEMEKANEAGAATPLR